MTRVVNKTKEQFDVDIGRPTKWGNPYIVSPKSITGHRTSKVVQTNEEAVKKYREWITKGPGRWLLFFLDELKDKVLGCYCKPEPCHGDVLVELSNKHHIEPPKFTYTQWREIPDDYREKIESKYPDYLMSYIIKEKQKE